MLGNACRTGWNSTDFSWFCLWGGCNGCKCEHNAVMQSRNNIGEGVLGVVTVLG